MMRALATLLLLAAPLAAQDSLAAVLSKMDAAAGNFKTMTADLRSVKFSSFFGQEEIETGKLTVDRTNPGVSRMRIDFTTEPPYTLLVDGTKAEIYRPSIRRVDEYDLSNDKDRVGEAFLMGFGASGKYLSDKYDISLEGTESAAGANAVRLELTPKDPKSSKSVRKIEMWVDTSTWQPVQQKVHDTADGDYRMYTYSNIQRNPTLPESQFKLKLPKDVQRVRPQN